MDQVIVVGAGVIGLTTGIELLHAGFRVLIIADKISPHTTSDKAGAIWFPFKALPREKVFVWSTQTLNRFKKGYNSERSGVYPVVYRIFTNQNHAEFPWWTNSMDPSEYEFDTEYPLPEGYNQILKVTVPFIDVPIFMTELISVFKQLGGEIKVDKIEDLSHLNPVQNIVVNCTGLEARMLTDDDELFPIRGQIVLVENKESKAYLGDDEGPNSLAYIFPRSDGLVLGGTAVYDDWNDTTSEAAANEIIYRCSKLDKSLENVKVLSTYAALRPGRSSIRLEKDPISNVIHNYGHGGSGFTVCWGCAREVLELIIS